MTPSSIITEAPQVPVRKVENSAALDQWRGLALIFVLISHGFLFTGRVDGIGRVGVNLFFFISGILVLRSLSSRAPKTDRERAFSFWKRRLIRLFPALLAYVAAMAPLVYLLQNRPNLPINSDFSIYLHGIPYALFYCFNYHLGAQSLGHLWSVSVEMQFYALAPFIFFLGGQTERQRLFIWGGILLAMLLMGVLEPFRGYQGKYEFQVAAWPMMLGFFSEYLRKRVALLPPGLLLFAIRAGWTLVFLTLASLVFDLKKGLTIVAGSTIFVPCFLSYVINQPIPGAVGRIFAWLGARTYSIYLWQQPLTICGYLTNWAHPLGATLAMGIGAVWYHFFERLFLSPRQRSK